MAEIVRTFAEDTKANLETMKRRLRARISRRPIAWRTACTGAARNVGADALAERASTLEQTVGSLSAAQIAAKIAAMQAELDVVLSRLETGIEPAAQEVVG